MTIADQGGVILADRADRDRIQHDLDRSFIVEAAAGTGKTTALVGRIVNVLRQGRARIDQIVAVTFTEKAAGELKLRLREELESARAGAGGVEQGRLEHALHHLEEARVSTIHGFCADLLRERPVEARIDPDFTVLTEDQAQLLYDQAFDAWLQQQLHDPGEGVRRALRRPARRRYGADDDEDGPVERLRRAGQMLRDWRDHPAPWRRPPFARVAEVGALLQRLHTIADMSADAKWTGDPLFGGTAGLRTRSATVREGLVPAHDLDGLEALLVDLRHDRSFRDRRKGSGAGYGRTWTRNQVWEACRDLDAALEAFERDANGDLAALLRDDLQPSLDRYEALKAAEGALDFLDLLLRTRDLLRDDASVRRTFRLRLTRLFVDEFQDTDPLQAEIVILLSGDPSADLAGAVGWRQVQPRPGALFIVGDPKQSIYRFRRADVGTYQEVRDWLAMRGAEVARLTTSFRSTPMIQRAVNAAFEPLMQGDVQTGQPSYVALTPYRPGDPSQPAVVALPVPKPYGRWRITKGAIETSLPDAVGAFVDWLIRRSGWRVTERDPGGASRAVPIEARHICLLFRRFTSFGQDVTRPYVLALESRDVPHLLVGGKAFHDREEVETLRAALAAIEWPDDELSVFATLRGALFAAGEERLLEYHHHFGPFDPYRVPQHLTERLRPIGDALDLLRDLHKRRNVRPVADTINALLTATRAHVGFVLRHGGEQALANVLHVTELARRYEAGGGISFRGFVEALADAAPRTDAPEAPILEDGSDGVRLMTVHKAKGLEFPVVVLVDMTCRLSRDTADRHLDPVAGRCAQRLAGWAPADLLEHEGIEVERDRQEGIRLAYVAATRARDLLVLPAVGDEPFEGGWASPLNGAIYPAIDRRRTGEAAPACPAFKGDSVLVRAGDELAGAHTVAPGLHRLTAPGSASDPHEVVWWDPWVLELGREPETGVRAEGLIAKDAAPAVVEKMLDQYREWERAHAATLKAATVPSLLVTTASEWAAGDGPLPGGEGSSAVTVWSLGPDDGARPSGRRFGTLVHAVLGDVPLDAARPRVAEVARLHARSLGAHDEECEAATHLVLRVLTHDLLLRACAAQARGECRREVPVSIVDAAGMVVEGVADVAFREDGRWVVVDFKTDVEIGSEGLERYRRQLGIYAAAITRATGERAEGILLRI